MNRKKLFNILLFGLMFIITFCYTYFISFLNLDEIWNYGFSYNISCGLVPYRDFNMLQTPLLFFIGSIFIKLFGNHLWSVHIFNSLLVSSMMLVMYKNIGKKMFILYPIVLVYSVYSYNVFCLFLGILILICLDNNNKYSDYIIALLVSLICLSKQNIGICLFIPMMIYNKHRIKSFIIFLMPNLILLLYLVINNALYDYVNYTFLGMFDFGKSNGIYYFIIFYIILVGYLLYKLVKSRFRDKYIFYILAFQVVGFPIIDDYHFMIGFILYLYYILSIKEIKKIYFKYLVIISIAFVFIYLDNQQSKLSDYDLSSIHLNDNKESFLYGRNFDKKSQILLDKLSNYVIDSREQYNNNVYVFANWAYLVKLNMGENPSIYDYILNGNMGYNGDVRIINNLENNCDNNKCLFIVQLGGNQVNLDIIKYVVDNYEKIDEIKDIEHNKKIKINTNYMIYSNVK